MLQLAQRIYNLLDELKEEADQKTCILVAHNGIARVVQSYFYEMTNEEYGDFGVPNCQKCLIKENCDDTINVFIVK